MFFSVFINATSKNLFHSWMGTRTLKIFSWVPHQSSLFGYTSLPSTLWPCIHGCIHLFHNDIRDEHAASGALGVWIPHYHTVCEHSLLPRMTPQTHICFFFFFSKLKPVMKILHNFPALWETLDLDMTAVEEGDFNNAYLALSMGRKE